MQEFVVEYLVSDRLDGVTPSPAFIPTNLAPSGPTDPESLADDVVAPDDDNIYRFDVTNLGLVDPDFGVGGTFADRFIVDLWIESPVAAVDPSPIAVLSTRVREIVQEFVVASLAGQSQFFREQCIFVPQGSLLGLTGFDASADPDDIVVRMQIKCADTLEEYALLLRSCCCTQATLCETPQVTNQSPAPQIAINCNAPAPLRTITLTGGPFDENTTVELVNVNCLVGLSVSISNLVINSPTELQFLVTCNGACTTDYIVSNGPGCDLLRSPGFQTANA